MHWSPWNQWWYEFWTARFWCLWPFWYSGQNVTKFHQSQKIRIKWESTLNQRKNKILNGIINWINGKSIENQLKINGESMENQWRINWNTTENQLIFNQELTENQWRIIQKSTKNRLRINLEKTKSQQRNTQEST